MKNIKFISNLIILSAVLFLFIGTSFAEAKTNHKKMKTVAKAERVANRSPASVKNRKARQHKAKPQIKAKANKRVGHRKAKRI